jgi:branched-chain amino acid aminotransferase
MVDLDWDNIGFDIVPSTQVISYKYANGRWDAGCLEERVLGLDVYSTVLHYGQSCFEGLKAFKMKDGKIRLFRPQLNAKRLAASCRACSLPAVPEELFLSAVNRAVELNKEYVPPYGSNGSLYVRPVVFGTEATIGLTPSTTAQFLVF